MKTITPCRQLFAMLIAIGFLAIGPGAWADGTVAYTGQGFNFDGTTYSLKEERCGLEGQTSANDGGTGQFTDWNGAGQPYTTGQPYLVWVLTGKDITGATLYLPDGTVQMFQVGGTFKFASKYYNHDTLVNFPVRADYTGTAKNPQLAVSHGCAPHQAGAWSPLAIGKIPSTRLRRMGG